MTRLLDAIHAHARNNPEGIALDPIANPRVNWPELAARADAAIARIPQDHAVGAPYVLQADHGIDAALLEIALLETGTPVLSLPAFFTAEQVLHATRTCAAELPAGTARITFTSGSSGTPKGVCLSAPHMLEVAAQVVAAVGAEHAGRHCALLPPGILLETVAGFYATIIAGGTYVCPPQTQAGLADPFRPDFARMLRRLADWQITSLILVPEYLAGLVAAMEASGLRLPLLTLLAVGGARVPDDLLLRARALELPVRQGYGLTECGSVVSLERGDESAPGSAGRPLPHLQLRIAEDGEILIEGEMFLGTIGAPRMPGPLATGDIGRIDADGSLWIEGRKSAMIITSFGRNIAPEWIEGVLTQQPGIAQAMVHGDGRPAPQALLVPARPDSDLAAAVAAANATLPAYARIAEWSEVSHFLPDNGMLTGNGRLRRTAIAAAWLDGEPTFFRKLEAATVRQRLAFLAVPQLQAGLAGTIPRGAYIRYLAQAYYHVRHTVPLMREARSRLKHRPQLVVALDAYIAEETGHEEWILNDITAAGGDADAVRCGRPAPATQAMVEHAYATIRTANPVGFFGMVFVLESVSIGLAQRGAGAVAANLDLPPEAMTYLTSHGALDQDHMAFLAQLLNRLDDEDDRRTIVDMARAMFRLFGGLFASIELEDDRAAA